MRKAISGICHICGAYSKLSFEHVPPKSAFNDTPILYNEFEKIINKNPDNIPKGRTSQRGAGGYTLCERCNNKTGHWYGGEFAQWALQGMRIMNITKVTSSLYFIYWIFPLRVLKQIVCMFFSANGLDFQEKNPELVKFVLNKEVKSLNPQYRFFVFYNISTRMRQSGITGKINLTTRQTNIFSEITFPPFGYVMTLDSDPPDERLIEITHFSGFEYNEWKDIPLKLPVLPVYIYFPADYRTKDEIDEITRNISK